MGCHFLLQCMKVKSESEVTESCPTLSDPMDCSLPGSSIHGIFQARVQEWGAIAHSEGNGYPFQYSCLENPLDRRAWWAAVHGVTQSRTRLKRLSMHACIGKGNGNPLQCPRDKGAWWAAVYGVTQSQTRLKRLSSSSSSCQFTCL